MIAPGRPFHRRRRSRGCGANMPNLILAAVSMICIRPDTRCPPLWITVDVIQIPSKIEAQHVGKHEGDPAHDADERIVHAAFSPAVIDQRPDGGTADDQHDLWG